MTRDAARAIAALLMASAVATAAVITVEPSGEGDYPTIQEGLSAAADGDTVLVEPGTYTGPDNRDLDFAGKNVKVRSSGGSGVTTIDCGGTSGAFYIHGGEDVSTEICGFTIINGPTGDVGAVRITGASATIRDCAFSQCSAPGYSVYGSAVFFEGEYGSPEARQLVIERCIFSDNSAKYNGVVYCADGTLNISDCEFRTNINWAGIGVSGISCRRSICYASDCLFAENEEEAMDLSDTHGEILRCTFEYNLDGAIGINLEYSDPLIRDCTFLRNRGTSIRLGGSSPTVENCEFLTNYGGGRAGGIDGTDSSPTVTNCVFLNNHAFGGHRGHAIHLEGVDGSAPRIGNCSSFGRIDWDYQTGGVFKFTEGCNAVVERSIIAFSGGKPVYCDEVTTPTITNCIFFGHASGDSLCGSYQDNLFTEPLWCNAINNDFDVCDNSPCLPENNSWGVVIGARGEGCGECITLVREITWGSIKAMYR